MTAIDIYTVVLQATSNSNGEASVEAIATNNASGQKVETVLSDEQVKALLNHSYGGEVEIVESYLDQISSQHPVELNATAKDPLLLSERELIEYGFDAEGFEVPAV